MIKLASPLRYKAIFWLDSVLSLGNLSSFVKTALYNARQLMLKLSLHDGRVNIGTVKIHRFSGKRTCIMLGNEEKFNYTYLHIYN